MLYMLHVGKRSRVLGMGVGLWYCWPLTAEAEQGSFWAVSGRPEAEPARFVKGTQSRYGEAHMSCNQLRRATLKPSDHLGLAYQSEPYI